MQLLIKVNDNKLTSAVERKFGLPEAEAIPRYKATLTQKRVVKNVRDAMRYYERKNVRWNDGMVVTRQSDTHRWGSLELLQFLIIKTTRDVAEEVVQEVQNKLPPWKEEGCRILSRAKYLFPYWDHLDGETLARVRDWSGMMQPLRHRVFLLPDFELVT